MDYLSANLDKSPLWTVAVKLPKKQPTPLQSIKPMPSAVQENLEIDNGPHLLR